MRRTARGARSAALALGLLWLCPNLAALPLSLRVKEGLQRVEAEVALSDTTSSDLVLTFRLPGMRGAALADIELSKGLSLVADSARPYVDDSGGTGSEIVIELASANGGGGRVESLRFAGEASVVDIEAFDLSFPRRQGRGPTALPWIWKAPVKVWRYQSFPLALRPLDDSSPPPSAWPSFTLPPGIFLEAGRDSFSWIGTALTAGSIELPPVRVVTDDEGLAPAQRLEVEELPAPLQSSRAVGEFSIALEAPKRGEAGRPLSFRIIVSGEGNLPALQPPEALVLLGGKALAASGLSLRRSDSIAPSPRGYKGSSSLEISLVPDREASLVIALRPWSYIEVSGAVHILSVPARRLSIAAASPVAMDEGRAKAIKTLEEASGPLPLAGEVLASYRNGRVAEALARLYHEARKDSRYRVLAEGFAGDLGLPRPELGLPFGPLMAFVVAILSLAATAFFFFNKSAAASGSRALILTACIAVGLAGLAAGGLSMADGARTRWLAWSPSLSSLPSAGSERSIRIAPGGTGRLIGRSGDWLCLEFPDGTTGWIPLSSVYSY
ncbi:MAG TPA: hypothetical protein VMV44_13980 [Rectinemataceae bacterium]|nr:hypothetical protein [Rectinemataceae bacterium]